MKKKLDIAFANYLKSLADLKAMGVLTNKKDFTSQLGEWLVETIYNGKRSSNAIEKGWDVKIGKKYIQVKTHAKAEGNNNRWSRLDVYDNVKVDELIIVVFTEDYKLKEFYCAPWAYAISKIKKRGKKNIKSEINWSSLKDYKLDIDSLPNQNQLKIFR